MVSTHDITHARSSTCNTATHKSTNLSGRTTKYNAESSDAVCSTESAGKLEYAASDEVPEVAKIQQCWQPPNNSTASKPEKERSFSSESDSEKLAMSTDFLTLPAKIVGTPMQCVLDSGAAISVVRKGALTTPTPPVSKLKLKGVLPGTGKLYGPKLAEFEIQGKIYKYPVYEADIQEDCLLGLNFMQYFYCVVDPVKFTMHIKFPHSDTVILNESKTIPTVRFHTGSLYFTVRSSQARSFEPNQRIEMKLRLEADCDVTETEIPEDSSTTDSEDGLGCFGEGATLPFQPNSSEETTCGRRIVLELPDWSRDVLVGGGSASTADHSTVVERRRDPARKQNCLEDNCSCLERDCFKDGCQNQL